MKSTFTVLFSAFLFFSVNALAAEPSSEAFSPYLHPGNYAIGGTVQLQRESSSSPIAKDTTYFDVDLNAEYFVIEDVSAGLSFAIDTVTDKDPVGTLGPVASWYFWKHERVASYVHAGYAFGLSDATVISRLTLSTGLNYFFTPSVAAGPSLFWKHYHSHFTDYNRYGVMVGLSIYL